MKKLTQISVVLVCSMCVSGCQLQRTLQRFTSSSKPEDPAYLLDPATEARQLAAISSQTRDDLNAFTDYSASEYAAAQAMPNDAAPGTAAAYLAQSDLAPGFDNASSVPEQLASPVQPAQAQIAVGGDTSYSGLSRYPVAASTSQASSLIPGSTTQIVAQPEAVNAQATSQIQPSAAQLHVRGVTPGAGPVRIALFDSAAAFPNRKTAQQKFSLDSAAQQVNAPLVASSPVVAVAAFQDLNNDGQLNRSAFGIPTEPYGFSGLATRSLGPPSFSEAAVAPSGTVEVLLTK